MKGKVVREVYQELGFLCRDPVVSVVHRAFRKDVINPSFRSREGDGWFCRWIPAEPLLFLFIGVISEV